MGVAMILDELTREVFGFLCHQGSARMWEPGGAALAACARCAGVYVGFVLALPLMILARFLSRPVATWLHGVFVLQVILFGFHLIPHGMTLRTISGQLFALGVVYFLFRAIRYDKFRMNKLKSPSKHTGRWLMRYLLATAQAVVLLQLLLRLEWSWIATLINVLALVGLGVFGGLAVVLLVGLVGHRPGARRPVLADGSGGS